ncbi:MAG: hypothetical protein PHC95_02115 [Parabacteroides sp.]|nr:hypothetical protein [Parabacteroides sp.]
MIWKYGRAVINALFKRRTKCTPICAELESKREANRDRSDIRMFEAGLSSEQYGDHQPSTRLDAEKVSSQLIEIAKAHDLYIPKSEWADFGERKRTPSGESIVYFDSVNNRVVKFRNPMAKAVIKQLHAEDIIYEHLLHNILFPDTHYQFMGISEDVDGIRIVLSQPYISNQFILPDNLLISRYLIEGLGLKLEDRYFYGNNYLSVTDVSSMGDNVLYDGEKLYFIDPIIKLKQPAREVLDYYYTRLK